MRSKILAVLKFGGIVICVVCIFLLTFGMIVKNMRYDDGLIRKIRFLGIDFQVGSIQGYTFWERVGGFKRG